MKVKCVTKKHITDTVPCFIKPYSVPKNIDYFVTFSFGTGVDGGVEYPLFVGAEYTVYGIMVHDHIMYYLISYEEACPPDWIPSSLFQVSDCSIPYFWVFQNGFKENDEISFIISHYEIATDFCHMLGVLQGYSSDDKKFRKAMSEY